jgi:putative flippase GtrA
LLQFLKYNFGGLLYFVGAWSIITFGTPHIGLWWANVIGNCVGITLNYTVQRYWAFSTKKPSKSLVNWKFVVLTVINLVVSYYILKGLVTIGVALWFAQFISAGFFTGWNWLWYKYWVFKESGKG